MKHTSIPANARGGYLLAALRGSASALGILALGLFALVLDEAQMWLVPAVLGAGLMTLGLVPLLRYRALKGWSRIDGELTRVEIARAYVPGHSAPLIYRYPEVQYRYRVNGRDYVAARAALERQAIWVREGDEPQQDWYSWQPGTSVSVYYNPARPGEAVLFPSVPWPRASHHLALAVGGLLVLGVAGWLYAIT